MRFFFLVLPTKNAEFRLISVMSGNRWLNNVKRNCNRNAEEERERLLPLNAVVVQAGNSNEYMYELWTLCARRKKNGLSTLPSNRQTYVGNSINQCKCKEVKLKHWVKIMRQTIQMQMQMIERLYYFQSNKSVTHTPNASTTLYSLLIKCMYLLITLSHYAKSHVCFHCFS